MNDETIDYAMAALEEYRKNTKNPELGVQLKVVDTYGGEDSGVLEARRPTPRGEQSLDEVVSGLEGTRDLSG